MSNADFCSSESEAHNISDWFVLLYTTVVKTEKKKSLKIATLGSFDILKLALACAIRGS